MSNELNPLNLSESEAKVIENWLAGAESNEKDYVSYTLPSGCSIPDFAMIFNTPALAKYYGIPYKREYLCIKNDQVIHTFSDPWPDLPLTVGEYLEKFPPLSPEEWLEKHGKSNDI